MIEIVAWIIVGQAALAAPPQSVLVETANRTFTLILDGNHLLYRSGAGNGAIKRTTCNEPLINTFWNDGLTEIKRFPKIKGGTLRPAAVVNGQRHLLRSLRSPAAVKNLDRRFHALQIQERIKCKRK